jgi:hypothetical protein
MCEIYVNQACFAAGVTASAAEQQAAASWHCGALPLWPIECGMVLSQLGVPSFNP